MLTVTLHYTYDKELEAQRIASVFQKGVTSDIQVKHKNKLKIILQLLDAASQPEDMDLPGMRFHKMKGNYKGYYSVTVNGNWRIIYGFEGTNAVLVDYLDYH